MDVNFGNTNITVGQTNTSGAFGNPASVTGTAVGTTGVKMVNGSVLGVNGSYNNSADFHTHVNVCDASTIQIGGSTTGLSHFYIYSGGTLKNYGNNDLNFSLTNIPEFKIDGGTNACEDITCALNILNDGTSGSIIYASDVTAPAVTYAANGPLNVNATNDILFKGGFAIDLNTSSTLNYVRFNAGNNIRTTGSFTYTSDEDLDASNYYFRAMAGEFTVSGLTNISTYSDCIGLNDFNYILSEGNMTFGDNVTVNKYGKTANVMQTLGGNFTVADGKTYTVNQHHTDDGNGMVEVWAAYNLVMGGVVNVTRAASTYGEIIWHSSAGNIQTKKAVTFTNNSARGRTRWETSQWGGGDIRTEDNVTFTHSGSGETSWSAGQNIISTDCDKLITFTHLGTGNTKWETFNGKIDIQPQVLFTKGNTNNGYTEWKAGTDINTHNNVTFTSSLNTATDGLDGTKWEAGNDINVNQTCVVAPNYASVLFTNESPSNDFMWWYAGRDIKVSGYNSTNVDRKINVEFTNKAAGEANINRNYMTWQAAGGNIDIDTAQITFHTTTGSKGRTLWYAFRNILMDYSKVNFLNDGVNTGTNTTNWNANLEDINANNTPIYFENNGDGPTTWRAGRDILLHHQSPTTFFDDPSARTLTLLAVRDIRTGVNSPLVVEHRAPFTLANITFQAGRNIWTESSVDITNTGSNNQTTFYAGQDIRIDSTITYKATSIMSVALTANMGDIIVNTGADDIVHPDLTSWTPIDWCDNHRAAVNFTLNGYGDTKWWARHNIIATDTIHFHYENTGNRVGSILFHAEVNNIDLRRPFKVDIDSASLVRLEAITNNDPANRKNKLSARSTLLPNYNGTQTATGLYAHELSTATNDLHNTFGSIRTSDSVVINRVYDSPTTQGRTQIEAYNDIQTAMFDFTSLNTAGDLTDIISKAGDIWLGYSWRNPTNPDASACADNPYTPISFDRNRFVYRVPATAAGKLSIKAGYDDPVTNDKYSGGNIYFTHIVDLLGKGGTYNTEISIPYSKMFTCVPADGLSGVDYERAGIIGGVARCQTLAGGVVQCTDTGLIHVGNNGNLLVDAGTQGNIIINNGAYLQFQQGAGDAKFLTRWGDIDMRNPFNADSLRGGLLFLANSELSGKLTVNPCTCEEMRNNVYLQDFQYRSHANGGSVFIGADNNIKLQYGGLKSAGSKRDPFVSGTNGYPCNTDFIHCDADTTENHARNLILNFDKDASSASITSGGFAAVASDMIDVYKAMVYTGGQGSGMSAVPGYGHLHGENVSGYGLYIKTQANKSNYNISDFEVDHQVNPFLGAACDEDICNGRSYLHQTARVTFHSDARIYAQKQKALITSPVLESYGFLDLNTSRDAGTQTNITIRTDSLIVHDSLIIDGPKTTFSTWSGLYRDMPILKLGHHRGTPPALEAGCKDCYTHAKDTRKSGSKYPLDTLNVTFRNDGSMPRLHTMVADHAIITFLTDSFDHTLGNPSIDTKFFTDTFKVRNHVELKTVDKTRSGHFELISEEQMLSKNYAGIYTRHLHMEPIGPACSRFGYSQLWLNDPTLSVITSSIFGGFGWLHNDVYMEIDATLAPGYGSLGRYGNCYEQQAGILRMQNLRMDGGADIRLSLGETESSFTETFSCGNGSRYQVGAYADFIDVKDLFLRGPVKIEVLVRPEGLHLDEYDQRCYPILHYETVGDWANLNNLQLSKSTLTSKDHPSINGTYFLALDFDDDCHMVSLCIVPQHVPVINREVQIHMPDVAGVTSNIPPGIHYVRSHTDFAFSLNFTAKLPLTVNTNRLIKGVLESELKGTLNENGEYEYVIRRVQEDIYLSIGPGYADATVPVEDGPAVWSHNNMLYIRVEKSDIASIYSIAGQLVKRIELPEGNTSVPLGRGVYVITLKDGAVHKVIIK
ncbi:MAG: T9SS type A sorting domain-containing protein [Tannerella sp.]|nr:T9SS type A sorting domain-containing protein [Tannerella sp.]